MSDDIPTTPTIRTQRVDRKLLAAIAKDPQLLRYLENLGLDVTVSLPDSITINTDSVIFAQQSAESAQSAANSAVQAVQAISDLVGSVDQRAGATDRALAGAISAVEAALGDIQAMCASGAALQAVAARVADLEDLLLDIRGRDTGAYNSIGDYFSNSTLATPVSNGIAFNATSIPLGPGDWDVEATIGFNMVVAATLLNNNQVGISTTSATMPTAIGTRAIYSFNHAGNIGFIVPSPTVRLTLTTATTVYAVGFCAFSAGTITADGFIRARRVKVA